MLRSVAPDEVPALAPALREVYAEAFAQPPYRTPPAAADAWVAALPVHAARPGFRMVVAELAGRLAGFAYGYATSAGQWWHDAIAAALGPHARAAWLDDAFEVVELAVHPAFQGEGVGGAVHDALLDALPHPTAILSTLDADTPAVRLYEKRGWRTLMDGFRFEGDPRAFLILGQRLAAPVRAAYDEGRTYCPVPAAPTNA